ncbi:MAG: hypothetical protein NVV62_16680 [Terricaulis sp.]|nr:hypothetical protein [Terricaulis sp.]
MTKYIGTSSVVGILLGAKAFVEGEGQHAGAGIVGVEPDMAAEAEIAGVAAIGEGRIGKERGGDGLQRARLTRQLDHVGFIGEVEIGLTVQERYIIEVPRVPTLSRAS